MTFEDLNPGKAILNALSDMGFSAPTLIQSRVYPVAASGRDVLGIAQTGTGKTLAYLLPVLRMWTFSRQRHPQILVVVPTRELAVQVAETAKSLTKYMNFVTVAVYGGTNLNVQAAEVDMGADMIVGTPGRLMDLVYHGSLKLKSVKKLVIDEVDEMLDLGFRPQLQTLLEMLPEKRQNLMFSATLSDDILSIEDNWFNNPEQVEAAPPGTPVENVRLFLCEVPNFFTKLNLLKILLKDPVYARVLVFASTKAMADTAFEDLSPHFNESLGVIHSNKSQNVRLETVRKFREGSIRILIATDIMARGIDISGVSHVINLDIPEDPLNFVHRIGRTGRAGEQGVALTLTSPYESEYLEAIYSLQGVNFEALELPANPEISEVIAEHEKPVIRMKNVLGKIKKIDPEHSGFHTKKAKNLKTNKKVRYADKMKAKYGKPKTRGQKPKGKKG
ncbi:MAG: DEAD/DEAH box helicase [Saprospiraceae bacterium]|nr:DEAD/DEAH box helicase [Saprospiraceae bacterium]